ncbi:MAG: DUF2461 family protein, partial [Oscillospiraceae bacterium]
MPPHPRMLPRSLPSPRTRPPPPFPRRSRPRPHQPRQPNPSPHEGDFFMFTGFSDKTIDFMYGIRLNNEKPWFEEHKSEYLEHFYNPMRDLADEVYDKIEENHPDAG